MEKQTSPQRKKLHELNIVANPASTRIKTYFSALAKGAVSSQIIPSSLRKVLNQFPTEDYLIHLQLFLHIEIDEIVKLRENSELEPLAPTNYCGYSPELYIELIFELNLHSEFIQMLAATKGMSFSKDLLSLALRRLQPEVERGILKLEISQRYLILLALLSRGFPEVNSEPFYVQSFAQLIGSMFQNPQYESIDPQKVLILHKLAGVACMVEEDYTGDTEIAELNKEWKIDPISFGCLKTKELFQAVLEKPDDRCLPISLAVLEIIGAVFEVEQVCSRFEPMPHPMKLMENLGVCAYVASRLLERNEKIISDKCHRALLSVMSHFSYYKPQLSWNDWKDMSISFDKFCQLLTLFGNRKRYQDEWFKAFCEYPDVFTSDTGLHIAEELVAPNATLNVAVGFVQKALLLAGSTEATTETSDDILTSRVKKIILSFLENQNVRKQRDEWIEKIFASGVHSYFAKSKFTNDLNSISTKIGAIEVETDPKCVDFYEDLLHNLCFQNAVEAVKVILQTCIRSQYFRALHMIKVYLNLPYKPPSPSAAPVPISIVIEEVLQRILTSVHELEPMCGYIAKGLPLVISEGFIRFEQGTKAIQVALDQAIVGEQFEKMAKLVSIYEQLVIDSLTKEVEAVPDVKQFATTMLLFTYVRLPAGKIRPFMLARESCLKILGMIEEKDISPQEKPQPEEDVPPENFSKCTLIQLGLVYIRSDNARKGRIAEFLSNPQNSWKGVTAKSDFYGKLVLSLLNWVTNSCVSEWPHLVNFLMDVILRRPDYQNVSIYELVSDGMLASRKEWECPTIYYLEFYAFVLTTLQNLKTENFHEKVEEQKLVYRTIVTLMLGSCEVRPAKPTQSRLQSISQFLQHALMVMLDFTEWIVMNCVDYENNLKSDVLSILSLIEGNMRGHSSYVQPIYQSIISRLNLGKKNLAEATEANAPKKKLVTGSDLSAPVLMSDKIFNEYMKLSAAEEIITNTLDTDKCEEREVRDLYPFKNRRPPVKRAGFKFQ